MQVTKPAVTSMFEKLKKLNLVKKTQSKEDKRKYYIELTDYAEEIYEFDIKSVDKVIKTIEREFTAEEQKTIKKFLEIF